MFERFTADAQIVVAHAQQHARRLGHRWIGCEHLLLAVASADQPAGAVLREHGITPERVEEGIVGLTGLGGEAGLFGGIDRDALSAIGIDLDAVRARIEAAFGAEALARAARAVRREPPRSRLNPRRAIPPGLLRAWRRRAVQVPPVPPAPAAVPRAPATGRYQAPGTLPVGPLPWTPRARKVLQISFREAMDLHDQAIGVEHIALSLITTKNGPVSPIVSAFGASGPALRAAVLARYRKAS